MDGDDSLPLISLPLLYRSVNVLYMRNLFLVLQNVTHGPA
jgi:hypothetical protein